MRIGFRDPEDSTENEWRDVECEDKDFYALLAKNPKLIIFNVEVCDPLHVDYIDAEEVYLSTIAQTRTIEVMN